MSDAPSDVPRKSIMPSWVRGPQDFVGGIALMAVAVFALWASSDLQACTGFHSAPEPRRACSGCCCWGWARQSPLPGW